MEDNIGAISAMDKMWAEHKDKLTGIGLKKDVIYFSCTGECNIPEQYEGFKTKKTNNLHKLFDNGDKQQPEEDKAEA